MLGSISGEAMRALIQIVALHWCRIRAAADGVNVVTRDVVARADGTSASSDLDTQASVSQA
jgi:hypothetical protein